jgi:hypothetical protein
MAHRRRQQAEGTTPEADEPDRGPAQDVATATKFLVWHVEPGPVGRGNCLVAYEHDGSLRFLAPPGVPLTIPEVVDQLLKWRSAHWAHGRLVGAPRVLTLNEALALAPNRDIWIVDWARERENREIGAGRAVAERVDAVLHLTPVVPPTRRSEPARQRRPLAMSRSASTFSAFLGSLDSSASIKHVEALTNAARDLEGLREALADLDARVGPRRSREAVLALLHARARSHSWRYTRWLRGLSNGADALTKEVCREIDRAPTGHDLDDALSKIATDRTRVDELLAPILYARSRSRCWRWTGPLRRLLASTGVRQARDILRDRVRPAIRGRDKPGDVARVRRTVDV